MNSQKSDLMVMKLLHYFITEKNYNPVIVHGVKDEIWLENMDADIKIIRIVIGYIHNSEQLDFDNFKVSSLSKQIKKKTFSFNMKVLSLYIDLNEDVEIPLIKNKYMVRAGSEKDLKSSDIIKNLFPDLNEKLIYNEKGEELYQKINNDILKYNYEQSEKINDLFKVKKPIVTNILIVIMIAIFCLMYLLGKGSEDANTLIFFGALVKPSLSPIRIITSIFLHIGIFHLIMNVWALKILGEQNETFYGHFKLFVIFLYSGIVGNLLSLIFMGDHSISAGASGSIFGLMGSLLYFAINQRTYMTEALKKSIIPVIIINVVISFLAPSINLYAHLGGLFGGMLISNALGIKYKTSKFEKVNGWITSILLVVVLTYLVYFV